MQYIGPLKEFWQTFPVLDIRQKTFKIIFPGCVLSVEYIFIWI